MKQTYNFTITDQDAGTRADKFLSAQLPDLSRVKIRSLIEHGNLKVNNILQNSAKYCLKLADILDFSFETIVKEMPKAKILRPLDVVFEDEYLIVLNKPAKLLVHGGAGRHNSTTLIDHLLAHCKTLSSISGEARPGIVHRLDMETSGLMVVAKDDITHSLLSEMFEQHTIIRKYLGLCYSYPTPQLGKISLQIKKSPQDKTRMIVSKNGEGRHSITHYRVVESYLEKKFSLIEFRLETGRTHQIRLHMEHKKNPIIGDKVYGRSLNFNLAGFAEINQYVRKFPRHALHSYYINFVHPRTQQQIEFEIPLPQDMQRLQKKLKQVTV